MARRGKTPKRRRSTRTPLSDEALIANLQDEAPEVLTAAMPEATFNAAVEGLLREGPSEARPHFYCRKCGEYHLKSHSHHMEMERQRAKQG